MSKFYPLTVSRVAQETRDAIAVTLQVPDQLKDSFAFTQGQHLTRYLNRQNAQVYTKYRHLFPKRVKYSDHHHQPMYPHY